MARDEQLKQRWNLVVEKLTNQFAEGDTLDLDAIIYLIGVQELGQIHKNFKKDDKVNLLEYPGYGYMIPLKSGWVLGFCEADSCTETDINKNSRVKWIQYDQNI